MTVLLYGRVGSRRNSVCRRGQSPRFTAPCPRLAMFAGKKSTPSKGNLTTATAGDSAAASVVKDWEQRDFTQTVQLGMSQLTLFLNQFGGASRRVFTARPLACVSELCSSHGGSCLRQVCETFEVGSSTLSVSSRVQMPQLGGGYPSSTASSPSWRDDWSSSRPRCTLSTKSKLEEGKSHACRCSMHVM
jgi:hypothetical protein